MVGRPERPVDPEDGPVAAFACQLRQLRRQAGNRPYRELAARAYFSHTTISDAARGERLPTLEVTLAFVAACGGDADDWKGRWHAYRHLTLTGNPPTNTSGTPATHGWPGPSPAEDIQGPLMSSSDEVLESPQPRHTERGQPTLGAQRPSPERRRLMVGLATALLSFAGGWQVRNMAGPTATAIAQQGVSTAELAGATPSESSTISTSDSATAVSAGALDPQRKNRQPWYKPAELPFDETLGWTYATPAELLRYPDIACWHAEAPALPQILSAQQKTYFSNTDPDGNIAEEEIYTFNTNAVDLGCF